jgi:histidyl-tRNA synthetase
VATAVLTIFTHRDFDSVIEAYGGSEGVADEIGRLRQFFADLEAMGLSPYVRFDLSVVRGLAYYTGMVFELFDARGELRALAGGGRYDDLLRVVSGTELPALGFGMGDVVLRELLADRGLLPESARTVDFFVVAVTPEQRPEVLRVVTRLRAEGRSVEYSLRHQSVGKQLKSASSVNAAHAIIIGPDEVAEGVVAVRSMTSGEELRGGIEQLIEGFRE